MTGTHPGDAAGDTPAETAALERLDAALDPGLFVTALTAGPGHRPFLTVTSRHLGMGDNIYADTTAYWWSWCERIAATSHPCAAAAEISRILGVVPEPSHG
jgi:hypothetical protein